MPASTLIRQIKTFAALLAVAAFLPLAGCNEEAPAEAAHEVPRNVRVLALAGETVSEFFEISGPVTPVRGTDLSAEESGTVLAIAAQKGAVVAAGAVIIELDRKILKAEMQAAAAGLAAQDYNLDKVRQLHSAGKVSRMELLTAESVQAQAQSMATVTAQRYHRAAVRAPFAGVVVDRFVEMGELVAPGQRVARVIDPYTLKLEAYLTDQQIRWVEVGAPALVDLGGSTPPAQGKVSWVGFEADRLTGKFKVEVELPNADLALRSGVIGRARLSKQTNSNVVAIPRDAVLAGRVGPTAYVIEHNRAVLRRLSLGTAQGLMVVVTSGLEHGDQLVVRGHRDLRDGSLVNITENAAAADGSTDTDPSTVKQGDVGARIGGATGVATTGAQR